MLSYFDNKIRFELNINTKYQIRKLLDIPNNSLLAVLESKANPILTVIDMAIKNDDYQLRAAMTLRDYEHSLLIKECDYDMSAIEAKVRFFSAKTTSITKAMEPYRKLCKWMEDSTDTLDIRALVA